MERARRKSMVGLVVSDKMDKTIVVQVLEQKPHPIYKKVVRKTSRFKARDEKSEARTGDQVRITSTRPLSKEVCWRLESVVEKAK